MYYILVFRVKSVQIVVFCCIAITGTPDWERHHPLSSRERYDTGHYSCDENPQRSRHKCPGWLWGAVHVRSKRNEACWKVRHLFLLCTSLLLFQYNEPVGEYFVLINEETVIVAYSPWSCSEAFICHHKSVDYIIAQVILAFLLVLAHYCVRGRTHDHRFVCHFFVLTTFWRHLWSITVQTHDNMESIC